ncbi:MAG: ABC transporter permease [Acidimicrobiia bacterium]|nr:ABC transporter permease [Acidimicrobiia bacterium]
MSALLKKSWRDLSRRKARTIFTVLTVALGVMGIGLFAITPLADRAVQGELAAENMHNIAVQLTDIELTEQQMADLTEIDNVGQVSSKGILPLTVRIGERRESALLVGVPDFDHQTVDVVRVPSGELPGVMQVLTEQGNEGQGVITLAEGDTVVLEDLRGRELALEVSGVGKNFITGGITNGGVAVFYTTMETIEQISGGVGITYLGFTLEDASRVSIDHAVEDIREYLVSNTSVVAFDSLAEVRQEDEWPGREFFTTFMSFFSVLSFFILFVSLFLISNTMNTMISEQTKEIAMMKAVGATRGKVFRSFLTTSALLGTFGAVLGAGLGVFVAHLVGSSFATSGFGFTPSFAVHWPTVGISVLVGVAVVLLASLPALLRTLRVTVLQGLESHGISADFGTSFLDRSLMGIRGIPRTLQMGVRNAFRRKGRSISTLLQVAFAVGVVIGMLNLGDGIIDATVGAYADQTWDIWAAIEDTSTEPMTTDSAGLFEAVDGVAKAEPYLLSNTTINDRTVFTLGLVRDTLAIDLEKTMVDKGQGRWWTQDEADDKKRVCVVGDALAKYEDIKLGDSIELMTATGAHTFEVIGIEYTFDNNGQVARIPLETFQDVLQKGNSIDGFFLQTDTSDHAEIDRISASVQDTLEEAGFLTHPLIKYVREEQNIKSNETISALFLMVSFIVVLIVLIGLMSTLVMNILDRTTEIGMLRVIGAKARAVRNVFSSEGLFIAFLGWIVGLPLAIGVGKIMGTAIDNALKLNLPSSFAPRYIGFGLVFTLIGTLIVIFFPLRRAARMKPGDALRYQ